MIIKQIGQGTYGNVCIVKDPKLGMCACKEIELENNGVPTHALREIAVLKASLGNEHLVQLMDISKDKNKNKLYLYLELGEFVCTNNNKIHDLVDLYKEEDLSLCDLQQISKHILKGIHFLHENHIMHRDLKPHNILVFGDHSNYTCKIADFGLAKKISTDCNLTEEVVTLWYRAPELLLKEQYSYAIDIWSVGAIILEVYLNKPLFSVNEDSEIKQLFKIMQITGHEEDDYIHVVSSKKNIKFPKRKAVLDDLIDNKLLFTFCNMMLQLHPHDRITSDQALMHAFLNKTFDTVPYSLNIPSLN